MRIVVSGGAGFIGSHVVEALIGRGDEVLVLDDLSSGRRENVHPRARFERIDLRDADAVLASLRTFHPEAISHQGAQTSVSRSVREPLLDAQVNVLGTLHLLEAAIEVGATRFVLASTGGAIYGEVPDGTRAPVSSSLAPISPYACSKLAAETYVLAALRTGRIASTVLRYANVYGPRQDPHGEAGVVAIFSRRLLAGEAITVNAMREVGDRGCVRDYVYVGDVVRANVRALDGGITAPIVNVCTGVPATTADLAERIAAEAGAPKQFGAGPKRAGDLERSVLEPETDPALAPQVSLDEGLRKTVAWFRETAPT